MRVREELHVAHDEVLPDREEILHHVADDIFHGAGVEDVVADSEEKNDEGKEREDGVGGDGEGVGVDLGAGHVADEGADFGEEALIGEDRPNLPDGLRRQLGVPGLGLIGDEKRHKEDKALRLIEMLAEGMSGKTPLCEETVWVEWVVVFRLENGEK